ncbi:gluconate 2-dehydrogenase subunit 3 family protein [Spirosoma sp.]|uniref:gluconate 2-dehydrogenase subunit 3 family protein n=1 Tax=Spirosoma sp. TaxID=1899569 RepID=UPI00261FA543|nr:gluconate 2-dehydrogenase subunit 3 family protein [Spirosoma sp.]MCX6218836.1 gluconate 2-dehydrogenase subunit 3 family protein [Spirosoma sp.]
MSATQPRTNPFIPRREALQRLALLVGGTLSLPVQAALRGEVIHATANRFSAEQQTLIADLADVIIPTTDTPGAKAAGVGDFIEYVIGHCSAASQQEAFQQGLKQTDILSRSTFGKSFSALTQPQQTEIVTQLTQQQKPFFLTLRELTIVGYFTSETGATKALDYVSIPGRFQGDIPMKAGQKTWAV